MVTAPLIDAAVLNEFFEKAEMFLTPEYLERLSDDQEERCRRVAKEFPQWPELWDWAPATRRLSLEDRKLWEPRLDPLVAHLKEADGPDVLQTFQSWGDIPKWLVDWATFWIHLANPKAVWWARWVYTPTTETGALLLVLDNPAALKQDTLSLAYVRVSDAVQYLVALLESTRALERLSPVFRPMVTLAVVYSVYMFTMASWKLSEEFTQVLPPFPVVVRTLLGVNRWGGSQIGPKSHSN